MNGRVLLVGPLPPPTGGVATHLRELARALRELGAKVDLVDPRRHGPDGSDGRPRLLARLLQARLRGDLIHLHTNGHNRGSWLVALACAGPRSILTLHSGLAPDYLRRHPRATRAIARRYARVIAVNREIGGALDLPSAHICPAFSPRSLAFRLPPPGLAGLRARHKPLLACALAPGPEYGAELLLDAFANLHSRAPRAGLLLYGPGTRALAGEVARRDLRQSVALMGELPRERGLAVVAACDLFVRPTLADGDAVSVREALALGRTVVASDVGHRPDDVLLFPAGSAAACAELLFHATSIAGVLPAPTIDDALPVLLRIYRDLGQPLCPVPVGTALAIQPQACAASPVE